MKLAIALLLANLSAGTAAPAPKVERIELEVKSWGRELVRWSINADGTGVRIDADAFGRNGKTMRDFAVGKAGFRKLRTMLGQAEAHAGKALPCEARATDFPYGEMRWRDAGKRERTLKYDTGCRGGMTGKILGLIKQADAQVEAWAKEGK